jgi:hypothetical protein
VLLSALGSTFGDGLVEIANLYNYVIEIKKYTETQSTPHLGGSGQNLLGCTHNEAILLSCDMLAEDYSHLEIWALLNLGALSV